MQDAQFVKVSSHLQKLWQSHLIKHIFSQYKYTANFKI